MYEWLRLSGMYSFIEVTIIIVTRALPQKCQMKTVLRFIVAIIMNLYQDQLETCKAIRDTTHSLHSSTIDWNSHL